MPPLTNIPKRPTRSAKVITLYKHSDYHGDVAGGSEYTWSYTTCPEHLAVSRAFAALSRDHPGEQVIDWKVVRDAG